MGRVAGCATIRVGVPDNSVVGSDAGVGTVTIATRDRVVLSVFVFNGDVVIRSPDGMLVSVDSWCGQLWVYSVFTRVSGDNCESIASVSRVGVGAE